MKISSVIPVLVVPAAIFLGTVNSGSGVESVIMDFISAVGIPAGIAVYVLVRLENTLKSLEHALDRNTNVLSALLTRFGMDKQLNILLNKEEDS